MDRLLAVFLVNLLGGGLIGLLLLHGLIPLVRSMKDEAYERPGWRLTLVFAAVWGLVFASLQMLGDLVLE